jgi:SAM-dependent methyltransferase
MNEQERGEFFHEIFNPSLPRIGPGDAGSTLRALRAALVGPTDDLTVASAGLRIIDLGCGNGAQTLVLAVETGLEIEALDKHKPFLQELDRRALALDCEDASFDLVWCEGAIFIMGFREGLARIRDLLAPGGSLALSELCWLKDDVPEECRSFFESQYPQMSDVSANLDTARACGYEVLDWFTQPESAWWEPFYTPLGEQVVLLREGYAEDIDRSAMLDMVELEIEIYRKYHDCYGNVFFVLKR